MTGMEIFAALSFVDERYIAEAETAKLGRNVPWMKVLSVAACLCILIVGAFALENFGHKGAMESIMEEAAPEAAPETAAPQAAPEEAPEAATEAAPLAPEDEYISESAAEGAPIPAGELQQIPYALIRIINVLDDGSFEAIVEEISDEPSTFEVGMQVTVVIDPDKVPNADRKVQNDLAKIVADAQIQIENGAYDASVNILYITGANIEEPAD